MSVITDILKEIPLSAVLKERLTQLETEMAVLKSENEVLKSKNKVLEAENIELKTKLQKIEGDKAIHGYNCPYCQQPKGKLLDIRPDGHFGRLGVKRHYYQCENCGKKYDEQKRPK
ncbi:MAG: hypothetical protein ABSG22_05830 [Sedimentisphaerales bacterium]